MRDNVIEDFDDFLTISEGLETPLKFFEYSEVSKDTINLEARVELRNMIVSYEGFIEEGKFKSVLTKLKLAGFVKCRIRDTQKYI